MEIKHYIDTGRGLIRIKDRLAAALLAFMGGWFGLHKFYTGRILLGIIYFLFCWSIIPAIIGFVEGVLYLLMTDEEFDYKYNR